MPVNTKMIKHRFITNYVHIIYKSLNIIHYINQFNVYKKIYNGNGM